MKQPPFVGRFVISMVLFVGFPHWRQTCCGPITASTADDENAPEWMNGQELRATYTGGIALIFEHRCVPCHRPGEVAPMSFRSYNEIRHWAGRTNTPLESLIQTRAMPPWPADP